MCILLSGGAVSDFYVDGYSYIINSPDIYLLFIDNLHLFMRNKSENQV